jgi:hypothetical protein
MTRKTRLHRRSVGVRYWRLRDLPFIAVALVIAYLAHRIDQARGINRGDPQ